MEENTFSSSEAPVFQTDHLEIDFSFSSSKGRKRRSPKAAKQKEQQQERQKGFGDTLPNVDHTFKWEDELDDVHEQPASVLFFERIADSVTMEMEQVIVETKIHPACVPRKDGEVGLDNLPVSCLHIVLHLLEREDENASRSQSKNCLNFMCLSKFFLRACLERGGLPSSKPMFCIVHLSRRADLKRLVEMMELIGNPCLTPKVGLSLFFFSCLTNIQILDVGLLECCMNGYSEEVTECCELFLNKGASVDAVNADRFFGLPIHFAARRGKLKVLCFFLLLDLASFLSSPAHSFAESQGCGFVFE